VSHRMHRRCLFVVISTSSGLLDVIAHKKAAVRWDAAAGFPAENTPAVTCRCQESSDPARP
ncbi:MAG: hypothetical protein ABFR53_13665, partial [Actinomycetota bacterium]